MFPAFFADSFYSHLLPSKRQSGARVRLTVPMRSGDDRVWGKYVVEFHMQQFYFLLAVEISDHSLYSGRVQKRLRNNVYIINLLWIERIGIE